MIGLDELMELLAERWCDELRASVEVTATCHAHSAPQTDLLTTLSIRRCVEAEEHRPMLLALFDKHSHESTGEAHDNVINLNEFGALLRSLVPSVSESVILHMFEDMLAGELPLKISRCHVSLLQCVSG